MITITDLKKSFGRKKVLQEINLTLNKEGIVAILGPNGSGKTTLIKSILGMVIPDSGDILFNEAEIRGRYVYRKDISYLPQVANFPENLKVSELISMISDISMRDTREDVLIDSFDLYPYLQSKMGILSGGTVQKVNLVLAFMMDCPLMILDEPTSGLDPTAMLVLKKMIAEEKEKGKSIIVTSHIMQFVEEIADEIVYLLDGRVVFRGSINDLLLSTKAIRFEEGIAEIARVNDV